VNGDQTGDTEKAKEDRSKALRLDPSLGDSTDLQPS
jgi:hypothetical protein